MTSPFTGIPWDRHWELPPRKIGNWLNDDWVSDSPERGARRRSRSRRCRRIRQLREPEARRRSERARGRKGRRSRSPERGRGRSRRPPSGHRCYRRSSRSQSRRRSSFRFRSLCPPEKQGRKKKTRAKISVFDSKFNSALNSRCGDNVANVRVTCAGRMLAIIRIYS